MTVADRIEVIWGVLDDFVSGDAGSVMLGDDRRVIDRETLHKALKHAYEDGFRRAKMLAERK